MLTYRICREMYALPLNGKGAAISGARWNSIGTEIIYTASNRSLAMAEVAVHLTLPSLPDDMMILTISLPPKFPFKKIEADDLPKGWASFPEMEFLHECGDEFIKENKYLVLKVPSAVTEGDYNLLINPFHPLFKRVKVQSMKKFPFDKRLIS